MKNKSQDGLPLGRERVWRHDALGNVIINQRDERDPFPRPKRFSYNALKWAGVTLVENDPHRCLECDTCGKRWMLSLWAGGRRFPGYWRCPNRCNVA